LVTADNEKYTTILPQQMAFFSWNLADDKIYGDAELAYLFDLEPTRLAEGLAILAMIDRISAEDRPRVAKSVQVAIITGAPYQETYRIERQDGVIVDVIAAGRCFRCPDGNPSLFAGTVIAIRGSDISLGSEALEIYCQTALGLAHKQGNELAARYISSALRAIGAHPLHPTPDT
jgi:hypothetical protein